MSDHVSDTACRIFVVVNPIAGGADVAKIRQILDRQLQKDGGTAEIYETTGDEDLAAIVRAACESQPDVVVAAGGDGTVAGVISGLVGGDIPLAILPAGTGNGLARALSIPLALEEAAGLLAADHRLVAIDVMRVGDRYYVLNVSAGISSRAMRATRVEQKRRFGILAYFWVLLKELVAYQPRWYRLQMDDQIVRERASEVIVTNASHLKNSNFTFGSPEDLSDGCLDVYIITARNLLDYLNLAWQTLFSARERPSKLKSFEISSSITIEAPGSALPVQADGETLGTTPVTVDLLPAVLQVIVPKDP